ncbi:5-dehydro-2-deoxygluconokinase [Thermoanaerobacter uzonensis DSM 18761]|uniref:5-dehydro-2-deoxygluconokinase n=1 Tax=Thermoanaerobacter uzonensis DSM 18761 TaxID=1123369 RepID=A0A1M4VRI6_9THEO|nr:sugar kinase [Thermoanaerobacter uzonensis]SHE71636.1 5-dehydro-2-deoxygluconokinase [Thermoanaerobacter uzonensis DSM 18761]
MDIVTFGESMVVFTPHTRGPLRHVHTFSKSIGGAEMNLAIALARLGHSTGWFSRLGDDEFGRFILNSVRAEGVDVSRVIIDKESYTGILFKEWYYNFDPNVYYYRKGSAASKICVDDIDENYIKNAKILHITGITPAISESATEAVFKAVEIAKRNKVMISFDPNLRLKLWNIEKARKILLDVAENADIVLPGLNEAKLLIGQDDHHRIADYFLSRGVNLVAIKLGKEGCYLKSKNEEAYVAGYKIEKIEDTVGAGDGFDAGLLAGILRGLPLKECGEIANAIGAMAMLVKGDVEGYPYWEQVMEFMGKKDKIER